MRREIGQTLPHANPQKRGGAGGLAGLALDGHHTFLKDSNLIRTVYVMTL